MKGVPLHFGPPGKPTGNAFNEPFNVKFRAECLNAQWFMSLPNAVTNCEGGRKDYSGERPHSAIGNKPPITLQKQPARRSRNGERLRLDRTLTSSGGNCEDQAMMKLIHSLF